MSVIEQERQQKIWKLKSMKAKNCIRFAKTQPTKVKYS